METPSFQRMNTQDVASDFVRRALAIHTFDNVAQELAEAISKLIPGASCRLLIVDTSGEVRIVGEMAALPQADAALDLMAALTGPAKRSDLKEGTPLRRLLDLMGADVLVPLRYRGAVIGAVGAVRASASSAEAIERLRLLSHEAALAVANAHLFGLRQEGGHTGRQVSLANALQDALCPEERPVRKGNMLVRGLFRPALECGGDFWTWEDLGRGKLLVVIGDVTGKGVPAAMLAATAKGVACAMRVARGGELNPKDFLRTLNASIFRAAQRQWLMTCFAVVIDTERGHMTYSNAGHNFPYVRNAKNELEQLVLRGNTLGAAADCEYSQDERVLVPGDCLLLFTDGVIDATNPQTGETYGEKRMRRLLVQGTKGTPPPTDALAAVLLAETERHKTPTGRMVDDITIVCVGNERPL